MIRNQRLLAKKWSGFSHRFRVNEGDNITRRGGDRSED
jgi:hypothetical protein